MKDKKLFLNFTESKCTKNVLTITIASYNLCDWKLHLVNNSSGNKAYFRSNRIWYFKPNENVIFYEGNIFSFVLRISFEQFRSKKNIWFSKNKNQFISEKGKLWSLCCASVRQVLISLTFIFSQLTGDNLFCFKSKAFKEE